MQAYDSTHWSCASPPDSVAVRSPSSRWRFLISLLGIVLVARVLWGVDFSHVAALLRSRGLPLVAVLLPFLVGMAVDTAAWRLILLRLGRAVDYGRLLRIRIASEALFLT